MWNLLKPHHVLEQWNLNPGQTGGAKCEKTLLGSRPLSRVVGKEKDREGPDWRRALVRGDLILDVIEEEEVTELQKMKRGKKVGEVSIKIKAARKIQAWWRGTLVRRTLLHAALRAWVVQSWWRLTLARMLHKSRRVALVNYSVREGAVVKLQSLVRMWRVHWRYYQVLSAIYIIQCHWCCHDCQTCALLRGHCVVTATHLQFHIEITNP
ncbi:IQ domain-containing protein F2 [Sturnira hondurensis]|uniref:IQ domain-containing protein F2 n=1 Tax=Sturnira hondurensis TaxID=192404 RepID=UPI00187B03A4|nr:IQ domain-containing protein F2 [Sturnira hondurensis]